MHSTLQAIDATCLNTENKFFPRQMVSQIAKARQRLTTQQHIDTPTDKQVAQSLGVSEEKVVLYTRLGRRHASLEDPGDGNALGARDEEDCLADVIEDHSPTAEDLIAQVSFFKDAKFIAETLGVLLQLLVEC